MKKLLRYFFVFWKEFGGDLLRQFFPSSSKEGVAFIVHPRSYRDAVRNNIFFEIIPESVGRWILRRLWPVTLSTIEGLRSLEGQRAIPGWVIAVTLPAQEMMERRKFARKKINQAVRLAKNRGALVVGLGALSGSLTAGGRDITIPGVVLTSGRAYTTHTVISYLEEVIRRLGVDLSELKIAIVGAAGNIGSNVGRILLGRGARNLLLIDLEGKIDSIKPLKEALESRGADILATHHLSSLKEAHIIITATNAPEAVVHSNDVSPGTIIIDDAQPTDIGQDVIMRDDVLVIEGGVITMPGISYGANFHLAGPKDSFSCMGEAMALAASGKTPIQNQPLQDMTGRHPYIVGISPQIIDTLSEWANALGFSISRYQYGNKLIPEDKIERVIEILQRRLV